MGKLTISMAIFNSYVSLPEGKSCKGVPWGENERPGAEDVMNELELGPNGALLYAMEYIEACWPWAIQSQIWDHIIR